MPHLRQGLRRHPHRGDGTIVGHTTDDFRAPSSADERARHERPMLIHFENCSQMSVVDVSLKHCGSWCMHLKNNHDIFLRNIRITRTDNKSTWGVPPAYGLYARLIIGLALDNINFQLLAPDMRSAVSCSDCQDVCISNLADACGPTDTSVVTAQNCNGLRLATSTRDRRRPFCFVLRGQSLTKLSSQTMTPEGSPSLTFALTVQARPRCSSNQTD